MQLCQQATDVIGAGGNVAGGFETGAFHGVLVDDAMPAVEKGIEQFQLYPGTIERGQDIDLGLRDQVLQLFLRWIGDEAGMGILMDEAGEPGRGVLSGNDKGHVKRGEDLFQQPDHDLFVLRYR